MDREDGAVRADPLPTPVRLAGLALLVLGALAIVNGLVAIWMALSSQEAYADLGLVFGSASIAIGTAVALSGIGVLRYSGSGRVLGLLVGGLVTVGGLVAGYVFFESWRMANSPPPEVVFSEEMRTVGAIEVAIPAALVALGAFIVWALAARWHRRGGEVSVPRAG